MKRAYFFIPGLCSESKMLEEGTQKTKDGDDCFIHYHRQGDICNQRCHQIELPKEE